MSAILAAVLWGMGAIGASALMLVLAFVAPAHAGGVALADCAAWRSVVVERTIQPGSELVQDCVRYAAAPLASPRPAPRPVLLGLLAPAALPVAAVRTGVPGVVAPLTSAALNPRTPAGGGTEGSMLIFLPLPEGTENQHGGDRKVGNPDAEVPGQVPPPTPPVAVVPVPAGGTMLAFGLAAMIGARIARRRSR